MFYNIPHELALNKQPYLKVGRLYCVINLTILEQQLEEIIEGCKRNKRAAREKLYKLFAPKMYGICLRYTKDQTAAEDVLQDGFIKIFKNIGQFRNTGSFEGWMRRIMVNTAIERYRKRHHLHNATEISEAYNLADEKDFMDDISAEELMTLVRELTPQYKMVFNLYVVEGYSHKDIAEKMAISEGTSKSNLARARKILQDKINRMKKVHVKNLAAK